MPQMRDAASRALQTVEKGGGGVTILVLGDLMLDRFIYGTVERISPEAPVPVLDVERETSRPGGAANVVLNLLALGARVDLAGIVGEDAAAEELLGLLSVPGCDLTGVVRDPARSTAVKTRVIAQHQQVVRFDMESRGNLSPETTVVLRERIESISGRADFIIVSDYGKAVVGEETMEAVRKSARPFAVDPKPQNIALYKGATVVTPNTKETELMCGIRPSDDVWAERAGLMLMERLNAASILVTRGESGMTLVGGQGPARHIPTSARDVFDVTGAGDTSIAVYALSLACGVEPFEAACLANAAAGIVVGKLGTATVTVEELRHALTEGS